MSRTKPGQKIRIEKLETTLGKLEKLEKKQQEELSLKESIYFLREQLESALKKGYSYQDLAEILLSDGINISAATLKQYLNESIQEKRSKKRVRQPKENKAEVSETKTSLLASEVQKNSQENSRKEEKENQEKNPEANPEVSKSTKKTVKKTSSEIASEFNRFGRG